MGIGFGPKHTSGGVANNVMSAEKRAEQSRDTQGAANDALKTATDHIGTIMSAVDALAKAFAAGATHFKEAANAQHKAGEQAKAAGEQILGTTGNSPRREIAALGQVLLQVAKGQTERGGTINEIAEKFTGWQTDADSTRRTLETEVVPGATKAQTDGKKDLGRLDNLVSELVSYGGGGGEGV